MRIARGPRPWSIWLFSVILIGFGLLNFIPQLLIALDEPDQGDRVALVSVLSAQFSIVAIPVFAVCVLASRVAKWFFTLLSIVSVIWMLYPLLVSPTRSDYSISFFAIGLLTHSLFILLFLPSAKEWFDAQRTADDQVFD